MVRRFKTKSSKLFRTGLVSFFAIIFFVSVALLAGSIFVVPQAGFLFHSAADSQNEDHGVAAFSDVSADYPYSSSVTFLKKRGIVSGYSDGTFKPDDYLKRAELAKILVIAHKAIPHTLPNSYCFKDVGKEWFAPYVCYSKAKGWVQGYEGGRFYPEKNLSKDEAVKMISKSLDASAEQESVLKNLLAEKDSAAEMTRGETSEILAKAIALVKMT
jgi:hypothetical protein